MLIYLNNTHILIHIFKILYFALVFQVPAANLKDNLMMTSAKAKV